MNMFSPNPYTRRRQQVVASVAALSGIAAAVLLGTLPKPKQATLTQNTELSKASFGRVALSPDGTRQVEFSGGQVVFRDHNTQQPLALHTLNNVQGVRFTPGGSEVLVHVLQTQTLSGSALPQLTDHVIVLDPITGKRKGEGPYTLVR